MGSEMCIRDRLKAHGKVAMVHMDLVSGLSGKEVAVDFIKKNTRADGIISTKPALIKRARELDLYTTLRVFVLDSMAFENIEKQMGLARPDSIEILPGLMPKVIRRVARLVKVPVIAGVLIGAAAAEVLLISIARSTELCVESADGAYSSKKMVIHSLIRSLCAVILVCLLWKFTTINLLAVVFGALGLKLSLIHISEPTRP